MTNSTDNGPVPVSPEELKAAIAHYKAKAELHLSEADHSMRLANAYGELLSLLRKEQTAHALPAEARAEALDATAIASPPRGEKGRDLSKLTYAEAATEVLRVSPRPMTTGEILEALKARGRDVGGKDPSNTIYTSLHRDARVKREDGKWKLKEGATVSN